MINFEPQEWYDKSDTANKDKLRPISAENLNRIENVLSEVAQHADDMEMHWWKRSKKIDAKDYNILWDSNIANKSFVFGSKASATIDIYYADSIIVKTDEITKKKYIELDNPITWSASWEKMSTGDDKTLKGKFVIVSDDNKFKTSAIDGGTAYYCHAPDSYYTSTKYNNADGTYGLTVYYMYMVVDFVYTFDSYVSSPNKNYYNEGWSQSDQLMYEYIGVPFNQAINSLKIQTRTYTGSGTSNTVSLTFDFTPKIVFVQCRSEHKGHSCAFMIRGSQQVTPFPVTVDSDAFVASVIWEDKKVHFKGVKNLNVSGTTYCCVAIG